MNESALATEFRAVVKTLEPKAFIFRHVEQFSRNVPDTSVTLNGNTIWIEFKRTDKGAFDWPQEKTHQKMGNVILVVFVVGVNARLTRLSVWRPGVLHSMSWTVLHGRKARNEAYRKAWSEIRPFFF